MASKRCCPMPPLNPALDNAVAIQRNAAAIAALVKANQALVDNLNVLREEVQFCKDEIAKIWEIIGDSEI